ncbi:MAG: hypothetical protein KGL43_01455 [Burkholderiales bacterium]|nr:hypothetical protein [Burkholderiales bacterium]MDE2394261.1 hypothetical protein [Burkholderiales bacterium]MDE2452234.1 hypothetical protein [Burkholderiales bacterium]
MSYEIHWEPRGAVKRYSGAVDGNELIGALVAVEESAQFDELRWVINDFLAASSVTCSLDEVQTIASIDMAAALTNPTIVIAVVATNAEIVALAQQYAESPMNTYPTRIFATLAEARAWLAQAAA